MIGYKRPRKIELEKGPFGQFLFWAWNQTLFMVVLNVHFKELSCLLVGETSHWEWF